MSLSAAERAAAHRAGYSLPAANRIVQSTVGYSPDEQSIYSSYLTDIAGAVTVANTAYWVYVGRVLPGVSLSFVEFNLSTVAVGTQAVECAIATSPLAPNKAAQTLTCVASAAVTSDLTSGGAGVGIYRNNTAFAWNTVSGSSSFANGGVALHIWAGFRSNFTSTPTQPQLRGLTNDWSEGALLSTAAAGVLTAGTTYAGALIAHAVTWQAPQLRVTTV